MNRAHYLKTDIRRLIKNYPIYLGIVGVAISMWFSLEDSAFTEGMVNGMRWIHTIWLLVCPES